MKSAYSDIINDYMELVSEEAALIKTMVTPDNIRLIKSGETYSIKKDEIIIVLEGHFTIDLLQTSYSEDFDDDTENDKSFRIGLGIKGMILGIVETYGPKLPLQYTAKQQVKIATFSRRFFEGYFVQQDKFNFLMKITAFTLAIVLDSFNERNFGNRYHVIRSMIYRYQKQSEEGVFHDRSLAGFILKRTKISRSYLFKILSSLKEGGYIEIHNGKLTSILKELPKNY
ncbi:hypothetical protein GJV06_01115 [Enterobacteriaceae bacterium RIT691]|nr:hypothetical protein [Enterobacteriaceae bacterium RIT691]